MDDNKFILIIFIWILILGYIVYKRNNSNTILLLMGILLSYTILHEKKKQSTYVFDKDLTYWIDTLINAKTSNEKNRCYTILKEKILYANLFKKSKINSDLLLILKQFEPTEPLEYNL
tara:strand:- start:893 stop:1246 length:354 start_codon:yes stop_codon:yes gene_type:complete